MNLLEIIKKISNNALIASAIGGIIANVFSPNIESFLKKKRHSNKGSFKKYYRLRLTILGMIIGMVIPTSFLFFREYKYRHAIQNEQAILESYNKGIECIENLDFEQAEKYLKEVYNVNRNLQEIKYYYAYTEFMLNKNEISYNILLENRDNLSEDELAFYSRFESDNENYDICRKYLNKIKEPEQLKIPALAQYVIITLNLAALEDADTLINTTYINTILLNKKINENKNLIENNKVNIHDKDTIIDKEALDELQRRVLENAESDIIMLNVYKLHMYLLFTSYSISYDQFEYPVYFFVEASEALDYVNNPDMSIKFLSVLNFYTIKMGYGNKYPEEIALAFENTINTFDELLNNDMIHPTEETKKTFDMFRMMADELNNNTYNSNNYEYVFPDGNTYEDIDAKQIIYYWDYLMREYKR